jgi:hypothetical protein
MTNPPVFGYPSISEPEVAAAVRLLLLAAGDNFGAELATLTDDPNMTLLVRGLAADVGSHALQAAAYGGAAGLVRRSSAAGLRLP